MHEIVEDYYGNKLQSSADLKTDACCDFTAIPAWLKPLLSRIHPEVLSKYYGCGLVAPALLENCRVLDLGSGSGRDVYALSQMVGPGGEIVGVDMTDQQLKVAIDHQAWHADQFGFDNVRFLKGHIEKLLELDLQPGSFDVIVSNCVINLSPSKHEVLQGVYELLKPGGEFYFSDVYADRRLPESVRQDPLLYGECLGGALYWNDFLTLARQSGFNDPRLVEDRPLEINDEKLAAKVGNAKFYSATYRLFKIPALENSCEDYGQAVRYRGGIAHNPDFFSLDKHHFIETGKVFPVCGNTWHMLRESRFADYFDFLGDFSPHYGIFEGCGTDNPFNNTTGSDSLACC